jgi:DNA-binding response OmpR family regulator
MTLARTITAADNLSELQEEGQVVTVDHLTVDPDAAEGFAEDWAEEIARLRQQDGFVSAQLRPTAGRPGAYVSIVVWRTAPADHDATGVVQRFGGVEVDSAAREVRKDGRPVLLTLKEFELLLALVSSPRRVFTRDELMDRVWGYRAALETGTLSVHVRRLRLKLEDDPAAPRHLRTVWGIGYRFVP